MTDTPTTLRDQLAAALALPINGPASDGIGWYRTEEQRAACHAQATAVLAVVQPLLDAKDTEIQRLAQERDAADEALHGQPVLRHCALPGCLREYDMRGGLSGKPVRESWSSKGWLMIPSLHSHICPEHTALVADAAHRPNWDRTAKPTVLVCACGWRSPGVRWTGFATAAWQDHLLTVTEET